MDSWLNGGQAWSANNQKYVTSPNSARSDWVTQTFTGVTTSAGDQIHGDGDLVSFGCALAFIFYLNTQLSFSIDKIISNYSGTLSSAYNALTGDAGDPFPFFSRLMGNVYPASAQVSSIPGPAYDNPFPLGILSFWCNNNTFSTRPSKDLVTTQARRSLQRLLPGPGRLQHRFLHRPRGHRADASGPPAVRRQPLRHQAVQPPATPSGPVPAQATPIFEDPSNTKIPQRIRFSFDVVFSDESAFPKSRQPAGHRDGERRGPDRRGEHHRRHLPRRASSSWVGPIPISPISIPRIRPTSPILARTCACSR